MQDTQLEIQNLSKNCNESLILAILYHERKHGYELALQIEEKSGGHFKFNHGTLYPILHKMEKEGLIKGTWKQEGPKRQRKYYTLTATGKKALEFQKSEWTKFHNNLFKIFGETET